MAYCISTILDFEPYQRAKCVSCESIKLIFSTLKHTFISAHYQEPSSEIFN